MYCILTCSSVNQTKANHVLEQTERFVVAEWSIVVKFSRSKREPPFNERSLENKLLSANSVRLEFAELSPIGSIPAGGSE